MRTVVFLVVVCLAHPTWPADFTSVLTRTYPDIAVQVEDLCKVYQAGIKMDEDIQEAEDLDLLNEKTMVTVANQQAEADYVRLPGTDPPIVAQSLSEATAQVGLSESVCNARATIGTNCYAYAPDWGHPENAKASAYGKHRATSGQWLVAKLLDGQSALIEGKVTITVTFHGPDPGVWGHQGPHYQCEFSGGQYWATDWDPIEREWHIVTWGVESADDAWDNNKRTYRTERSPGGIDVDLEFEVPFYFALSSGQTEMGMYASINPIDWETRAFFAHAYQPPGEDQTREVNASFAGNCEIEITSITVYE